MPVQSQNDIVSQFMLGQDSGKEVKDKIRVPDLSTYFNKPLSNMKNKIKVDNRKILSIVALHTLPKDEIVSTLMQTLDRRGVVSFEWLVGKDYISVSYIDGFSQKELSEENREALKHVLVNVLKSRKAITGVKWELGQPYIEVSYIA